MEDGILEGAVSDAPSRVGEGLRVKRPRRTIIVGWDSVGVRDTVSTEASGGVEDGRVGDRSGTGGVTGPVPVGEGALVATLANPLVVEVAEVTVPRKELGLRRESLWANARKQSNGAQGTHHTVDVIRTRGVLDHVLIVASELVGEGVIRSTSALQALHCRDVTLLVGRAEVTPGKTE